MPGGTIDVAGGTAEPSASATIRAQSTAPAKARRTRASSNGGRRVSKP